jgi:hypothetical protein
LIMALLGLALTSLDFYLIQMISERNSREALQIYAYMNALPTSLISSSICISSMCSALLIRKRDSYKIIQGNKSLSDVRNPAVRSATLQDLEKNDETYKLNTLDPTYTSNKSNARHVQLKSSVNLGYNSWY